MACLIKKMSRFFAASAVVLACFAACDLNMGMGPPVDLEPPEIRITEILLPDGTSIPVEGEANRQFIGRGIMAGAGFELKGIARDNINVDKILVEEIGSGATWHDAVISPKLSARQLSELLGINESQAESLGDGWQSWSIILDGIQKGERNIRVTAQDIRPNSGAESVRQLTLLVDTDLPFVQNITIQRAPEIRGVQLLPRETLEDKASAENRNRFENIDFFQNESFAINAEIDHLFSLSAIILNLYKLNPANGNYDIPLFPQGLSPDNINLYAPQWSLTAEHFSGITAPGPHYLRVSVTATATAGHSGVSEENENLFHYLCWYPESDLPRIQAAESLGIQSGSIIPVGVFDDDQVGAVYAGLIHQSDWESFMPGSSNNEKLEWLASGNNRLEFDVLGTNRLRNQARNPGIIDVDVLESSGYYRLVILARDNKPHSTAEPVWNWLSVSVSVIEEGVPFFTNILPEENSAPLLTNGIFTMSGAVTNITEIEMLRLAWIPDGIKENAQPLTAERQIELGTAALRANTPQLGIVIWDLNLSPSSDESIGGKVFKKRTFEKEFNILTDFMFNGSPDNEPKVFILYTEYGNNQYEIYDFRYLSHRGVPIIDVTAPEINFMSFGVNADIDFMFTVTSPLGVPIDAVTLTFVKDNSTIELERDGNEWSGKDSHNAFGEYEYRIKAKDGLGNEKEQELFILVEALPSLRYVTSPHNDNTDKNENAKFSGQDTVTIHAVFSGAVNVTGNPRIKLEGFDNAGLVRYAHFDTLSNHSTTLVFHYKVEPNDRTVVTGLVQGLKATRIELNGGTISSSSFSGGGGVDLTPADTLPARRVIHVDAVAPKVTGIAVSGSRDAEWQREGDTINIEVTVDKDVRVSGIPHFELQFDDGARKAIYHGTEGKVLHFSYTIIGDELNNEGQLEKAGDFADPMAVPSVYILDSDLAMITDTIGATGNILTRQAAGGSASLKVDANPPAAPTVTGPLGGGHGVYTISGIESGAAVEFTTNGTTWLTSGYGFTQINWSPNIFTIDTEVDKETRNYIISARQTDLAGNVSHSSEAMGIDVGASCELVEVMCTNADNSYRMNQRLTFRLVFTGRVNTAAIGASGPSITLVSETNAAVTHTLYLQAHAAPAGTFTLDFPWLIQTPLIMEPVRVQSINLTGIVPRAEGQSAPDGNPVTIAAAFNRNINVRSIPPAIVTTVPVMNDNATISGVIGHDVSGKTVLTLNFNGAVWPERGMITVRPASNWLVPPVMTNDEYFRVTSASGLTSANRTTLDGAYKKNTHGLRLVTSADVGVNIGGKVMASSDVNRYVPDVATKYVLDFNQAITGIGSSHDLRTAFDNAKYLWQEIEVINQTLVTGRGTSQIKIHLDGLPAGRPWQIQIPDGAFRDAAGNQFAAWSNTFWSEGTAAPVIRVERVSNNHPTTDPTTNTVTGVKGESTEVTARVNVRYRIDCETPGASIQYATSITSGNGTAAANTIGSNKFFATITDSSTGGSSATDGSQNSSIPNALKSELDGITLGAYSSNALLTIGDTSLYTARKDYIVARAHRLGAGIDLSERGYEGAFKTLLIYRIAGTNNTPYVKYEGADTYGGAPTIAGFPMSNNDMTGRSSKHAYRFSNSNNREWIWISWEIVSVYYQVALTVTDSTPNTMVAPSWTGAAIANYNYRKFGDYGLQVGF